MTEEQTCENCKRKNPVSEYYCFVCGHILPTGLKAIATQNLPNELLKPQIRWGTAYFGDQMVLRIMLRETNDLIEARFENECVIGRAVEDVTPDIDLTRHNAVELGVSRRHVKLTRQSATIMVQDLGSVNGTFLNGQKLLPYQPRVLRNEDELRLGHMTLRISFMRGPRAGSGGGENTRKNSTAF
jgi:hypothetical protein